MGSNFGGLKGLNDMRYKPPKPPITPYHIWRSGELKEDHEVKEFKDEKNWLEDELDIQKTKDFNWKPVLSVVRKVCLVAGLGWFIYKLMELIK